MLPPPFIPCGPPIYIVYKLEAHAGEAWQLGAEALMIGMTVLGAAGQNWVSLSKLAMSCLAGGIPTLVPGGWWTYLVPTR
jgi:hypothetical protein